MTKWEYERFDLNNLARSETDLDVLNGAGAQGWELVSINSCNIAIMKRAVATPTTRTTRASATSAASATTTGTTSRTK